MHCKNRGLSMWFDKWQLHVVTDPGRVREYHRKWTNEWVRSSVLCPNREFTTPCRLSLSFGAMRCMKGNATSCGCSEWGYTQSARSPTMTLGSS